MTFLWSSARDWATTIYHFNGICSMIWVLGVIPHQGSPTVETPPQFSESGGCYEAPRPAPVAAKTPRSRASFRFASEVRTLDAPAVPGGLPELCDRLLSFGPVGGDGSGLRFIGFSRACLVLDPVTVSLTTCPSMVLRSFKWGLSRLGVIYSAVVDKLSTRKRMLTALRVHTEALMLVVALRVRISGYEIAKLLSRGRSDGTQASLPFPTSQWLGERRRESFGSATPLPLLADWRVG